MRHAAFADDDDAAMPGHCEFSILRCHYAER